MEKTNYFKNNRRKYPDNFLLASDILKEGTPECTLPSLKGAPAQANIEGANRFLLSSVHPSPKREIG